MENDLGPNEKIALIKENLQEVLRSDLIEDVIVKQNRPLVIYWGTATTGRPHCGYFVPVLKIAQFLKAGCKVKILLADIHGFLDNLKAPLELVNFRAEYYRFTITALLKSINVPIERLEFVLGSSYQLSKEYTMDIFRICSITTEHDAKKAGAEVVKQVSSPLLSGLVYPLMQALDEQHLGVDAQFGGVDQRKIFALAAETLPKLGYKERAHLMNPMVPGLAGGKMSASDPDSKIDLLDTAEAVTKKLKKAHAVPKETESNGIISFTEYVLLPMSALKNASKPSFEIQRRPGEGDALVYTDIKKLKEDYAADILTPQLLKGGVTAALIAMLAPIQEAFTQSPEWQDIEKKAYPPPAPVKKVKKEKKIGTRYAGGSAPKSSDQETKTQPDGHVEGKAAQQTSISQDAEAAISRLEIAKKN